MFTGCGGGSSSATTDTSTTDKISTAIFDAASTGVTYVCGSQTGSVAENGTFSFEEGKDCTFYDGSTAIQTIPADTLKAGATFVETTTGDTSTSTGTSTGTDNNTTTNNNNTQAATDLATLLFDHTYYAVQPGNTRVVPLRFYRKDGSTKVDAIGSTKTMTTDIIIKGNVISIPLLEYSDEYKNYAEMTFISEEDGYLLFEGNNRMYTTKEGAEAFVAAN